MPKANFLGATPRAADIATGVILAVADVLLVFAIGVWARDLPRGSARSIGIWLIVIFSMVAVGCVGAVSRVGAARAGRHGQRGRRRLHARTEARGAKRDGIVTQRSDRTFVTVR